MNRGAPKRLPDMKPTTIWLDEETRSKAKRIHPSMSEGVRMAIRAYQEKK